MIGIQTHKPGTLVACRPDYGYVRRGKIINIHEDENNILYDILSPEGAVFNEIHQRIYTKEQLTDKDVRNKLRHISLRISSFEEVLNDFDKLFDRSSPWRDLEYIPALGKQDKHPVTKAPVRIFAGEMDKYGFNPAGLACMIKTIYENMDIRNFFKVKGTRSRNIPYWIMRIKQDFSNETLMVCGHLKNGKQAVYFPDVQWVNFAT